MRNIKTYAGITGLRALACLSVIAYHLNQQRPNGGLSEFAWDFYRFVETWPVAVSFFFVLSGAFRSLPYWRTFQFGDPKPSASSMVKERFVRIAPAYYAALAVSFLTVLLLNGYSDGMALRLASGFAFLSWIHPSTFFPVDLNGPLWYVPYEITGGLLCILIMESLLRLPKQAAALALAAWTGILLAGHFAFSTIPFAPWNGVTSGWFPAYNPFLFGLHYGVGILLGFAFGISEKKNWKDAFAFDFLAVSISAGLIWFLWDIKTAGDFEYSWPSGPHRFPLVATAFALVMFAVAHSRFVGKWLDNRLFSWIAKVSYSAYLFHGLALVVIKRSLYGDMPITLEQWAVLAVATVASAFVLAWFWFRFVEKPVSEYWKRKSAEAVPKRP